MAIIGKTKSGKDVHDRADHPGHKGFSREDHLDAMRVHSKLADMDPDHFDHNNEQRVEHYHASRDLGLSKAEGARGGRIVGHTKSGRPIYADSKEHGKMMGLSPFHVPVYENYHHPAHKEMTPVDHMHAAMMHEHMRRRFPEESSHHQHHKVQRNLHISDSDLPSLRHITHRLEQDKNSVVKPHEGKNPLYGHWGIGHKYIQGRLKEHYKHKKE